MDDHLLFCFFGTFIPFRPFKTPLFSPYPESTTQFQSELHVSQEPISPVQRGAGCRKRSRTTKKPTPRVDGKWILMGVYTRVEIVISRSYFPGLNIISGLQTRTVYFLRFSCERCKSLWTRYRIEFQDTKVTASICIRTRLGNYGREMIGNSIS